MRHALPLCVAFAFSLIPAVRAHAKDAIALRLSASEAQGWEGCVSGGCA